MKGTVIPLAGKEGTVVKHPRGCPTATAAAATVFNVESANNNSIYDNGYNVTNNSNDDNSSNDDNFKRGSLTLPSEPN